jgi:hypothetical protein
MYKELRELLRQDLPPRATFSDIGDGLIRKLPHGADYRLRLASLSASPNPANSTYARAT